MEKPENRKLKVAYVANAGDYHVIKWSRAIVNAGVDLTIVSFDEPDQLPEGANMVLLSEPSVARVGSKYLRYMAPVTPLRRCLEDLKPDVLVGSFATHYGHMAARTKFHPFLLQTWTTDLTVNPVEGPKRSFWRRIAEQSLQAADLITTDGPGLLLKGKEIFPEHAHKMVPLTWGIQLADFRDSDEENGIGRSAWGIPEGVPVISNTRGVYHWYRPEIALKAIQNALEKRNDLHSIVLTLEQERTDDVQRLLDQLNQHPRCCVMDRFLSTDEMRTLWQISDAFISIPKFDGISEGLLEGMYCGAIPIVSDIDSNRSLLSEDQALFVQGDSTTELTSTLLDLIQNLPDLRATHVQRNRDWVSNNASVEATARKFVGLLRSLMESNPDTA